VADILWISGPRDGGPGERQQSLTTAHEFLKNAGDLVRVDVPEKGAGLESEDSPMRLALEPLVPALQSGSLFGGSQGVMLVDAENLLKAEAGVLADLITEAPAGVLMAVVSAGAVPAPFSSALGDRAEKVVVKKVRERDAGDWLATQVRRRKLQLDKDAREALIHRFGTDLAALGQALDQLEMSDEPLDAAGVRDRFKTRPDEPVWLYSDAVAAGDVAGALRRLGDYLTHSHPLALLGFLENDLRRRALAQAAPDIETLAEWTGQRPDHFPLQKAWNARMRVSESELTLALDAISRADQHLKSAPEETHRVTMERLTVALCRWYGGPAARKG
jgi:DNA polymerase III delta subunit